MRIFLIITSNVSTNVELIQCETIEIALDKMKRKFEETLGKNQYDFYNTFIDEDARYAQVVYNFQQTEFRIGQVA